MIGHCPVSENDVNLAEAIFGTYVPALKGKTPRSAPKTTLQETIATPPELVRKHSGIELYIDVICANRIGFLTSIGCPLCHRKTLCVSDGETETLC